MKLRDVTVELMVPDHQSGDRLCKRIAAAVRDIVAPHGVVLDVRVDFDGRRLAPSEVEWERRRAVANADPRRRPLARQAPAK
jgi:hypothetical protein